jgi:CBS domain-containing protein
METLEPRDLRYRELTARMLQKQKEGTPVHNWEIISPVEDVDWSQSYQTVEQFMSTDLFTVRPDDLIDLAASVMDWRHVRHVPVEDDDGRLVGLVTHRALLHLLSQGMPSPAEKTKTVREIMKTNPVTVSSGTPTLEAMELMQSKRIGCLPVVDEGRLVGILTSYDFLVATARIFREHLSASTPHVETVRAKAHSA